MFVLILNDLETYSTLVFSTTWFVHLCRQIMLLLISGKEVDPSDLKMLPTSSSEQHIFHVSDYDELQSVVERVTHALCPGRINVTWIITARIRSVREGNVFSRVCNNGSRIWPALIRPKNA